MGHAVGRALKNVCPPCPHSCEWSYTKESQSMVDDLNSVPDEDPREAAEHLSRSYESFLGQQEWEGDSFDDAPSGHSQAPEVEIGAPPPLKRIVEALLFVGGAPLNPAGAAEIVRGLTAEQFAETIASLN